MFRGSIFHLAAAALIVANASAGDFEELAGELPRVVTAEKSPYIVTADVFVPAGKSVRLEPGTILLFRDFTGLHVQGVLIAAGSKASPVVLTSVKDRMYNPQSEMNPTPFDWNGVYIHKDGIGTELDNVKIMYSVKGIVSETRFFRIDNGEFVENGRSNLTIEGQEKDVGQKPFSYSLSVKDATVDGVPVRILKDPELPRRTTIRYSGLAMLVGGGVLGGVFGRELVSSSADLDRLSTRQLDNLAYNSGAQWKSTRDRRNLDLAMMTVGIGIALVGGAGISWSFTF